MLRDLTVKNTGGSSTSVGLYNDNDSPVVNNAAFIVSGGTGGNVGVLNINSSAPTLTDTNVEATGGAECYGVSNNSGSTMTLTGVSVSAEEGADNYGIRNAGNTSSVLIMNSVITSLIPFGGSGNYTVIKIDNADGMVRVLRSSIVGFVDSSGDLSCAQSDNRHYEINYDCKYTIQL